MKNEIIEILKSERKDQVKFKKLIPHFRNISEPNSELRKAVNQGFTPYRLHKVKVSLMAKFEITDKNLEVNAEEETVGDLITKTSGPSTEPIEVTKDVDYMKMKVDELKVLLKSKGVNESLFDGLGRKKDLISLIPEEKKN